MRFKFKSGYYYNYSGIAQAVLENAKNDARANDADVADRQIDALGEMVSAMLNILVEKQIFSDSDIAQLAQSVGGEVCEKE
jgi:hypothetical protein